MRVLIVGANGHIGRRLIKQMAAGFHQCLAMIRRGDQAAANTHGKQFELLAGHSSVRDAVVAS